MEDKIAPISVIIPVYNHADELMACLLSLESQTIDPAEVIIVDDGSTDDLAERMTSLQTILPVQYVRLEKNQGAPVARNEGFRRSTQPFVIFLDADILLRPTTLQAWLEVLRTRPDIDFVYSSFYFGKKRFRVPAFDPMMLRERNYIHTSALLRREAFPGFDERLKKFQDWDLWLTMIKAGSVGFAFEDAYFQIKVRANGYSRWMPAFLYKIPWEKIGWMPKEIRKYRAAEKIIREKHGV